jgi:inorganic pyrophosphatase
MDVHVGRLEPADWLGRTLRVVMDRPLGSLHPVHGFRYELNYGYVPGYIAPDGEELDAYVVGTEEVLDECEGVVIAVVVRADDLEDKLVIAVDDRQRGIEEIEAAVAFQESAWNSEVIVAP